MIVTQRDGVTHVQLNGRFDVTCAKDFRGVLADGGQRWVIDLTAVEYVDSSALGILLLVREQSKGNPVRLVGARGQIREVLLMAKFDRLFAVE